MFESLKSRIPQFQNEKPKPVERPHRLSTRSISQNGVSTASKLDHLKTRFNRDLEPQTYSESVDLDGMQEFINSIGGASSLEEVRFFASLNSEMAISPQSYDEQMEKFSLYHNSIVDSRKFFSPLTDYLEGFQLQLSKLSAEMEFLQKKSISLNNETEEKKVLDAKLTPIINDILIPPDILKSILNDEINSKWIENLRFLQEKREIYQKYDSLKLGSLEKMTHLLEKLKCKAIERIRDFLIRKVKQLRVYGVSSQVVQQEMLEVKDVYEYLLENQEDLALELRQAYVYTMRWYYTQGFSRYLRSLERLQLYQVGKNVLLGNSGHELDDSSNGAGFSFLNETHSGRGGKKSTAIRLNDYLNLDRRGDVIKHEDPTVMLAQIAETSELINHLEVGFHNFNMALLDNVSVEYLFCMEFFKVTTYDEMISIQQVIWQQSFQMGVNYTRLLIAETYDSYGILICIRLCQAFEYELQRRKVPVMEEYFNLQLIALWPRFQKLIDYNCENMKKVLTKTTSFFSTSGKMNPLIPQPLTQQFGRYLTGLLNLTSHAIFEVAQSEPLSTSILRLRNDFESVLTKLSSNTGSKKESFLYNNYFLVYTMLSDVEGKLSAQERDHFKQLIEAYQNV